MRLVPTAALLVFSGCTAGPDARGKSSGDSAGLGETGTAADSGVPDTGLPAPACRLRDVEPRTLSSQAGGAVTWTWACPDGADAGGDWSIPLPGSVLPAAASAVDGVLQLHATVPGGAVTPGAYALGGPTQDGAARTDLALPLRVHAEPESVAAGLARGSWNTWGGDPADSASFFLDASSTNREPDLLGIMLEPSGDITQTSHKANGQGIAQIRHGVAHTSESGVFTSGGGTWVDAGDGAVMAVVGGTEPGHVMHVRQSTWQAPDWVITVLRINHGFMRARVPDLLLGMETIWRWRELPDVDLLGVVDRGAGPLGLACEDTNCWEWAELGGVAAADVVAGTGFVGMFVGGELSGLQERTREPLFWAASQPKPHGDVQLAVSGGDERLQAFFPLRTVHLPAPGFPLEAVSTAAEDLDGDGTLELLVELWGEGGWAAWLVPDAHDPGSTRSPVALGRIRAGAVWTAPGPTATGASAMLASSFSLNARALRATVLRAAGPRVGESAAAHVWAAEWDPASLLSGAAQVGPVRAGVAGHVDLPAAPCAAPSGTILSACRGAWVARGVAAAGETGAVHPDDAYTGGDHLLVVPGAGHTHVLVGRGLHPAAVADPAPVAAVGSQGDTWLGGDVGLHLRSASGSLGGVCHGAVQAADGPEGPLVVGQTGQDCATGGGRYTVWRGTEMSPLHIVGGDDGTPLTLLHEVPSEQGWPVLWRRGDGQAWGGWLDLGARPPAWADTPTPLGAPVDPGMLGLGRLRPAAVQVSALESPALALHTGWSEGAALPGEPGARVTALAVGDGSACGHAVAVLRGGELATLFEGVDPTCADLPLPQAALRLGDEEALVSLAADGSLWLSRLSGEFAVHRTIDPGMPAEAEPGPHARVEAGDLNGDGIDDLLLLGWRGTAPRVLLLDGHGGPLPAGAVHEQDVLLNVAGIARPGPSRPAPARAWDPALPLVQRRLVPLVGR